MAEEATSPKVVRASLFPRTSYSRGDLATCRDTRSCTEGFPNTCPRADVPSSCVCIGRSMAAKCKRSWPAIAACRTLRRARVQVYYAACCCCATRLASPSPDRPAPCLHAAIPTRAPLELNHATCVKRRCMAPQAHDARFKRRGAHRTRALTPRTCGNLRAPGQVRARQIRHVARQSQKVDERVGAPAWLSAHARRRIRRRREQQAWPRTRDLCPTSRGEANPLGRRTNAARGGCPAVLAPSPRQPRRRRKSGRPATYEAESERAGGEVVAQVQPPPLSHTTASAA